MINSKYNSQKFVWLLLVAASLLGLAAGLLVAAPHSSARAQRLNHKLYLPMSFNRQPQVLLGVYPHLYWTYPHQEIINSQFIPLEQWSQKRISLAGVFHEFNSNPPVEPLLSTLWINGYTPFVNIAHRTASAQAIANGSRDQEIISWAKAFAVFANEGERMAFLAPLQEMNGNWVSYYGDPYNYQLAFRRIQQIFAEQGVPRESVHWVFAPNGWSRVGDPGMEAYYPGDDYVDAVAISAYNFGNHPSNAFPDWIPPEQAIIRYLDHATLMAPNKPLFLAQTGTSAYYATSGVGSPNAAMKNQWLKDSYTYLATYPNLRGILYFNEYPPQPTVTGRPGYDFAIFVSGVLQYQGYVDGVNHPAYIYMSPSEIKNDPQFVP